MKPILLKGTRDFGPDELIKRGFIFDQIESVFKSFAYQSIETPAMESLSTLTGKYGEEGDRLLFKILNNGDFLAKANDEALRERNSTQLISSISKRGLRYDLTVPFARFVSMNQHRISFPFKRYQIQPVWRADRPQKGRYQEFYQCDVDVVGSNSLLYEAELTQIYDEVFTRLNLDVTIKLNNRKILSGLAEKAGISDRFTDMTICIDKLDKIGLSGVKEEMQKRGIHADAIHIISDALQINSLAEFDSWIKGNEKGEEGIEELKEVFRLLELNDVSNKVVFDITLARGLNYYTGCIFEVVSNETEMGSIGGGGRYDDLTSMFGLKGVSGVGVSFGAERIYDIMETLDRFPSSLNAGPDLLFLSLDQEALNSSFSLATTLRKDGWKIDVYPEPVKLRKQMKYANDKAARFVAIIGDEELKSQTLTIKKMSDGVQTKLSFQTINDFLKKA